MSLSEAELQDELEDLVSAEDFLDYFEIEFEPKVVQVNRLHILTRFSHNLADNPVPEGVNADSHYRYWLQRAYLDFVGSSAQEQKVLKVFQPKEPGFVSFDDFD